MMVHLCVWIARGEAPWQSPNYTEQPGSLGMRWIFLHGRFLPPIDFGDLGLLNQRMSLRNRLNGSACDDIRFFGGGSLMLS